VGTIEDRPWLAAAIKTYSSPSLTLDRTARNVVSNGMLPGLKTGGCQRATPVDMNKSLI
jgi:hypothetical protein